MAEPVMVVADRLRQSLEWMAEYITRLHATVDRLTEEVAAERAVAVGRWEVMRRAQDEVARLTGELADARSEIARHHVDFPRWEAGWARSEGRAQLLREALSGPVPDDWEQRAREAVR